MAKRKQIVIKKSRTVKKSTWLKNREKIAELETAVLQKKVKPLVVPMGQRALGGE